MIRMDPTWWTTSINSKWCTSKPVGQIVPQDIWTFFVLNQQKDLYKNKLYVYKNTQVFVVNFVAELLSLCLTECSFLVRATAFSSGAVGRKKMPLKDFFFFIININEGLIHIRALSTWAVDLANKKNSHTIRLCSHRK